MNKITSFIIIIAIFFTTLSLSACDIGKKYDYNQLNDYYTSIVSDSSLKELFDDNKNIKLVWSEKVANEFDDNSSILQYLDLVYTNTLKSSFDCFSKLRSNISIEWEQEQTTNVYNYLIEFRKSLADLSTQKSAFEESMSSYVSGVELNFVQKNLYDVLVTTFTQTISDSLNLSNYFMECYFENNYENYWLAETFDTVTWPKLKAYLLNSRLLLSNIVYKYDIMFSYEALNQTYTFGTDIAKELYEINKLYTTKENAVSSSDSYTFTNDLKFILKKFVVSNTEIIANYDLFSNALNSIDSKELHKNSANLDAYYSTLKKDAITDLTIVEDFTHSYVGYINAIVKMIISKI